MVKDRNIIMCSLSEITIKKTKGFEPEGYFKMQKTY